MDFMRIASGKLCGFAVAGRNDEDPRWKDDLRICYEKIHTKPESWACLVSTQPANSVRDKHIEYQ